MSDLEDLPPSTSTPGPTPGPAVRVQRTAAQIGGVAVVLELVDAFGWLGSDRWTDRQGAAVTGAAILAVSIVHNVVNYLRAKAADEVYRGELTTLARDVAEDRPSSPPPLAAQEPGEAPPARRRARPERTP